ncbi:hypothetical protein Bbelb_151600 [Branchiostoma belcheri]|nr:hypothetical protein Bbelb_151600 [Branchiostoma belcheri]
MADVRVPTKPADIPTYVTLTSIKNLLTARADGGISPQHTPSRVVQYPPDTNPFGRSPEFLWRLHNSGTWPDFAKPSAFISNFVETDPKVCGWASSALRHDFI